MSNSFSFCRKKNQKPQKPKTIYKVDPLNEDDQKCEKLKNLFFVNTLRLD